MKFKDYLIESFDTKPVSFKRIRNVDNISKYRFEIDSVTYTVFFQRKSTSILKLRGEPEVIWDVSFSAKQPGKKLTPFGITNTGNQFKVLSTVMAIMSKFIDERPDTEVLAFSAVKETLGGQAGARTQVYRRLVKRNVRKLPGNWEFTELDLQDEVKFILSEQP